MIETRAELIPLLSQFLFPLPQGEACPEQSRRGWGEGVEDSRKADFSPSSAYNL